MLHMSDNARTLRILSRLRSNYFVPVAGASGFLAASALRITPLAAPFAPLSTPFHPTRLGLTV
jgi:hypothetical protein